MNKYIVVEKATRKILTPLCNDLETALDKAIERLKHQSLASKLFFKDKVVVNDFKDSVRNNKHPNYIAYSVEYFFSHEETNDISRTIKKYSNKYVGITYAIFGYYNNLFCSIEEIFVTPLVPTLSKLRKIYKEGIHYKKEKEEKIDAFLDELMAKWRSIDEDDNHMLFIVKLYLSRI